MRKLITTIMIFSVILSSYTCVFAASNDNEKVQQTLKVEKIDNSLEKDIIKEKMASFEKLNDLKTKLKWDKTPSKTGELYKIYNISDNLYKYDSDKNFNKFLSEDKILWETPVFSEDGSLISTTRVSKVNGTWYESTGSSIPLELVEFYLDYNNIYNVLKENKIDKPEVVKHVRIRDIYTDIIYIKNADKEYAIPLVLDSKELGIENFKLYKMSDLIEKLKVKYVNPNSANKPSTLRGGSNSTTTHFFNNITVVLLLCGIVSFILALIITKRVCVKKSLK